jgi:hypothetical protein
VCGVYITTARILTGTIEATPATGPDAPRRHLVLTSVGTLPVCRTGNDGVGSVTVTDQRPVRLVRVRAQCRAEADMTAGLRTSDTLLGAANVRSKPCTDPLVNTRPVARLGAIPSSSHGPAWSPRNPTNLEHPPLMPCTAPSLRTGLALRSGQCGIERFARPHHRRGLLAVRRVVAADLHRLALSLVEFGDDGFFVLGQRFG